MRIPARTVSRTQRRPRSLPILIMVAILAVSMLVGSPARQDGAAAAAQPRVVAGWFGYWSSADQVREVVGRSGGTVGDVMMFMWSFAGGGNPACLINPSGGGCISGDTAARYDEARAAVQAAGGDFYASHTDLDANRRRQLSEYLATSANRQAMADLLTSKAVAARVDGVDLDWENFAFNDGSSTWSQTRYRFVDTVQRLGKALRERGKRLSVTVPGGYSPWSSTGQPVDSGGYWVYAWSQIAPHVDRLRFMTYDYSHSNPTGIGPNDWAERVVTSAKAQVGASHAHKIWVGVPQYGRRWAVRQDDGSWGSGKCPATWSPATATSSLSLPGVRERQTAYGATAQWDSVRGEWTFRYSANTDGSYVKDGQRVARTCTATHQVWYADQRSARARLGLVSRHGIGGITVWNLGGLEGNFFSAGLAAQARSLAARAAAPLPITASLGVPQSPTFRSRGVVQVRLARGAQPVAARPVALGFKPRGVQRIGWYATRATNASGVAEFPVTFRKPGRFVTKAAPGAAETFTKRAALRITPTLVASTATQPVAPGERVAYLGTMKPAREGIRVTRVLRQAGAWQRAGAAVTNSRGRFRITAPVVGKPVKNRSRFDAAGGSGFTPVTSPTVIVRADKQARVEGATGAALIAPRVADSGAAYVVRATLRPRGKWRGERVQFGFQRLGSPRIEWRPARRVPASGVIERTVRASVSGRHLLRSVGDPDPMARSTVRVRFVVTAAAMPRVAEPGSTIVISGSIGPAEAGIQITRSLRDGSRWVPRASTRTDREGRFSFPVSLFSSPREYRFRITAGAGQTAKSAVARVVTVTAR